MTEAHDLFSSILAKEDGVHVINAPSREHRPARKSIFLAGTTSATGQQDWRQTLVQSLSQFPIDIYNPSRPDWDATWREDFSDSRWAEQVEWELEMQDAVDLVVILFHGVTAAPISLLELGLCVRSGKAVVCALDGYSKRGNVEAVCRRYSATFVTTEADLATTITGRLMRVESGL